MYYYYDSTMTAIERNWMRCGKTRVTDMDMSFITSNAAKRLQKTGTEIIRPLSFATDRMRIDTVLIV